MRPRLVIVFLLLLAAPIVALALLGVKVAIDERGVLKAEHEEMIRRELASVDQTVTRVVEQWGTDVLRSLDLPDLDPERLRDTARSARTIRQIFVVSPDGKLVFPPPVAADRTSDEEEFLVRTKSIWDDREPFWRPGEGASTASQNARVVSPQANVLGDLAGVFGARRSAVVVNPADVPPTGSDAGWFSWYWGSGLHLVRWKREASGRVIGAEIDRMAFLSDVLASLPATDPADPDTPKSHFRLADANGAPVFEWGLGEPSDNEKPRFVRELSPPLGSWRIEYFPGGADLESELGGGLLLGLLSGLGALVLVVAGLAAWFLRESGRDIREALRRVSFVNQVSHELKTPLTNIRMYAELLDEALEDGDETSRAHVQVIVDESRRLSRLIGNVLTFARQGRGKLTVRPLPGVVDDVVAQVIEQFRPVFASRHVDVRLETAAAERVQVDADALGQVLGNLLGNIEKYAAQGGRAEIATRHEGDTTIVEVADNGPGVPAWAREKVFEPFWRMSNSVTDGITGTGIGLSIARDLARLHGGDLVLVPSQEGARFRLTLGTPPASNTEESR